MHPWQEAGTSKSSWYRYLKEFRAEVECHGFPWLIEKIKEQVRIKASLSEATKKLAGAKTKLKMRKDRKKETNQRNTLHFNDLLKMRKK